MHRWCTCLVAGLAAFLLAPQEAWAQTVTLNSTNVRRSNGFRDQSLNPTWISQADCLNDDKFIFPLTLSGFPAGYSLQVWVGESGAQCADINNRTGTTAKCWKVTDYTPTSSATPELTIPVRDIIARNIGSNTSSGGDGTCTNSPFAANDTPQPLDVYFLPILGNTTGAGVIYSTKVDLMGPSAPIGVKIGVGESILVLEWNQVTSGDITGYQFFCDPPPGSEGTSDVRSTQDPGPGDSCEDTAGSGGTTSSGGTAGVGELSGSSGQSDEGESGASGSSGQDEAGGSPNTESVGGTSSGGASARCITQGSACPSVNLMGGKVLKNPEKYRCGTVSGLSATKGTVGNLQNFKVYTIAVAATDGVGNVGPLSTLVCETPQPIDDFFKVYRDAGGRAGGGYCQVNQAGMPMRWIAPLLAMFCSLGTLALRRRGGGR